AAANAARSQVLAWRRAPSWNFLDMWPRLGSRPGGLSCAGFLTRKECFVTPLKSRRKPPYKGAAFGFDSAPKCGYGDPSFCTRLAVAKPELGTTRIDPETGRKFYDLNKDPIVSPYTGKSY